MSEVVVDDGMTIHYDVFGRRDGPPLLMIQGLGTDSRGWALQRLALGRRYRCITIDNRGVGRTGPAPEPYSLERMALDAIAVLDAEEIDRAHVMGASMGGVIAQIIGVLHPDRTRS
ncbi:MAG: alpha/beta hydrolase, partial [Acidimicrobiia bacterium]